MPYKPNEEAGNDIHIRQIVPRILQVSKHLIINSIGLILVDLAVKQLNCAKFNHATSILHSCPFVSITIFSNVYIGTKLLNALLTY